MARFVFEWDGNDPALNFVNTLDERLSPAPLERLESYEALVTFTRQAEIINARTASTLLAGTSIAAGRETVAAAVDCRETLHRVLKAGLAGRAPGETDLATLNSFIAETHAHRVLTASTRGIEWTWDEPLSPRRPLWELALAIERLLFHERKDRVRKCDSDECGTLFIDLSKTGLRRWCSMSKCGNRSKARRFRSRKS
jgi:predicted RNA-binding Zn ribbon-like protein